MLRRGSEDDLHADGERLVQALPEIQADPGSVSERVRQRLGRQQAGVGSGGLKLEAGAEDVN